MSVDYEDLLQQAGGIDGIMGMLREALCICPTDTIIHIGVVGSHAYGDNVEGSDYDLMVVTLMPTAEYISPVGSRIRSPKRACNIACGDITVQATTMDLYHLTSQVASRPWAHMETVFGKALYCDAMSAGWRDAFIKEIYADIQMRGLLPWVAHFKRMLKTYVDGSNVPPYNRASLILTDPRYEKSKRQITRTLKFIQWLESGKLPSLEMMLCEPDLGELTWERVLSTLKLSSAELQASRKTGIPLDLNLAFIRVVEFVNGSTINV